MKQVRLDERRANQVSRMRQSACATVLKSHLIIKRGEVDTKR